MPEVWKLLPSQTYKEETIMKWWTVSILLLVMVCLAVPFVTADKGVVTDLSKKKIKTPAAVEIKPIDSLAYAKQSIGWKANTDVEVIINGKWMATIPDDSVIKEVQITQECIAEWPYGTLQWYRCEVS
jgi:hypothetical protein